MAVVVTCVLLVLAGIVAVVRWGDLPVQPPPAQEADAAVRPPSGLLVRRYLWYATLALATGVGAGVLAAGAGSRLVMRLLAATAGPEAQGQVTEAAEVVGRISVGGTIGLFLFGGVLAGLLSAAAYLLLRRWLPAGRAGGLVFGALLLVVAGTRVDPLRDNNPDFSLVGPPWLAVAAFLALGLFHGMVVVALAGRYSRALPLVRAEPRTIAAYAPLLLLVPLFAAIPVIVALGLVALLAAQVRPLRAAWQDRRVLVAGRVLLAAVALAALPGFVWALATILNPT
ncbi:MAG TPA: hypothetical protein VGM21_14585 [Actinomycetota bacterium]|jgi:hypothetical protein